MPRLKRIIPVNKCHLAVNENIKMDEIEILVLILLYAVLHPSIVGASSVLMKTP